MNTLIQGTQSARLVGLLLFSAAVLVPLSAEAQSKLSVSPTSVKAQTTAGTNAPSQTVRISNSGKGSLRWSVVALTTGWLSVSPTSGVNNGTLTLMFATSGLIPSTYQGSFRVDSNGGSISVNVELTILPAPALTITCPSNVSVTSPDGAPVVVTYSVTTSGGVPPVTVTGSPASGSSFPVGTSVVNVIAHSSDGQEKSCAFSVTVTQSPGSSPSGVGPQLAIVCPAGAIDIWPGDNIQNVVDSHGTSTSFCLRAGTHYMNYPITPKTGDTFVGEYGAILDATGWATTDDTLAAFRAHDQDIDYVTIRNLVIRKFRRGIHAFGQSLPDHWTIEHNEIASNYSGLVFPSYSTIRNNYIHHNDAGGYIGVFRPLLDRRGQRDCL